MEKKPESVWKKSWRGPRWLLFCLIPFTLGFAVVYANGDVPEPLKNYLGLPIYALFFSIFVTLILLLAVKFVCWLGNWHNIKRFLFGLACCFTLLALFYAEENWRGKRDWEKYKREWEAKGEKFNFADFIPPTVRDDQNFAMSPIFDATRKLASRKWRDEHQNRQGSGWDTNLVDPLQIQIGSGNYNDWPTNVGDWRLAKTADLKEWQNYYRWLATKTNEFPIALHPQSPAQDVLLALGKYDSTIQALRQASQLPYSRFPLDYDDEDPAEILLPHLAALKRCSQILRLRALAELADGQTKEALDDVMLGLRLANSVSTEPFIITHLVRIAILELMLQPVWEGLAEHKWSDAQLAALDMELAKLDFPADYEFSARGERAAHVKIVDWMEQKRSRFWDLFNMINDDERNLMNNFGLSAEIYLMPKGWYDQSKIELSQVQQQRVFPMANDSQQTVSPQTARESVDAVKSLRPSAVNLFARLLFPELGKYAERAAYGQNAVSMARVAIALERYRLAHGEFPGSLDALAPQFMDKIPHDVIGGQPLHYRRADDGQFVLYSVGWNETDDGGVVVNQKSRNPQDESANKLDNSQGDWVWRYPAK